MTQRQSIEDFLYDEAALLDRPDLDRWMTLFTADGFYWMPAVEDQVDPLNHISHVYDDRVMMEIRRRNFVHPRASSKDHRIRCSHVIGNVRLIQEHDDGSLEVGSNQHVVVDYRDEQRVYAYRGIHLLHPDGDTFLIKSKRVNLINPEAPQRSLIVYL
ncbi:aromatic-ring-hydroxylating dioxygenase, beta subunit [Luminiphilus syltensis NOR5-1B]|uniref:Aromatic-ring-hydroxylating dioxygenase, beta subunit n=1 Tax=Luminiphilus syltensis NOR5-1B TaxID=565045 RepID=B8KTQ1_9GAMM|nr:aromatic-ring-hydroxylating dioxygenase subunit beta [Luminiphilus syltensis]EED35328.1 aromatic-ring-hydroxylating dioxygenase, beta subunit [Luminiphilus syltensis NOR5-1B]